MIFTEIDRKTMQSLCTLVKLTGTEKAKKEEIVNVGQYLGVPKDDTLELLDEWDESDTMKFSSEEDKKRFLKFCFGYMEEDYRPKPSEVDFYNEVVRNLGLETRFDN